MKKIQRLLLISCVLFCAGCGEYNAAIKYGDAEYKYEVAKTCYARGQYARAQDLFNDLLIATKGTGYADECLFLMAMSAYMNGDMETAADIATRVFYANAPGMLAAYVLCDIGLTVIMIVLVWKRVIPLKSTLSRILATLCNPIMCPGIVGNLVALLPWPVNQLDHGTESFGHALVLMLGLILLKEMGKSGGISSPGVAA